LWAKNWLLLCAYLEGEHGRVVTEGKNTLRYMDRFSHERLAYLLLIVGLSLLNLERRDQASQAFDRARGCSGWWGSVVGAIMERSAPDTLDGRNRNPNIDSETLLLVGEAHLRLGSPDLARQFLDSCEQHSSHRTMTRNLARMRLGELAAQYPSSDTRPRQAHGVSQA
jgi:hypothetical protein